MSGLYDKGVLLLLTLGTPWSTSSLPLVTFECLPSEGCLRFLELAWCWSLDWSSVAIDREGLGEGDVLCVVGVGWEEA